MLKNVDKQKVAANKMVAVDLSEVVGFEMLDGQMKLQKLNWDIVETFVAEIVVYA